jgi:carbonic anhydrase/acetyltransferase-like protein (isoleucine patch superfamily)
MPLFSFEGASPTVDPAAFVAPTAVLVGDVTVEAEASVWYGAVLRADYAPIVVRRGANVQDGSVVHAAPGAGVDIGEGATVGHLCVVHGATLGREALIGNGATLLDGCTIGDRAMVAAHSLVAAGFDVPAATLAAGSPAVVKREIAGTAAEMWVDANPQAYRDLAARHRTGVAAID